MTNSTQQINWHNVHQTLQTLDHGEKTPYLISLSDKLDCSKDTIYRKLRCKFGKKKEIEREKRVDPDNRLTEQIMDMKLAGEQMHLKERELSTEICIQLLIEKGVEGAEQLMSVNQETGEISYKVPTINRRLNEIGYRERQPNKRIESLYANQVHMIDFSRSKYFQIHKFDAERNDYLLKVSGKELHYKQGDRRLRTWVVQYLDDFSRIRKVRYYPEANESAFLGLEHLNYSYVGGPDEHLLSYLPKEMLRSDNGSFRRASETQAAMDEMDITMPPQMPGQKGGTAKVENRMRSLWQQFELPRAVVLGNGSTIWLSELNELVEEFTVMEHYQQHPVRSGAKGEVYERSLADRSITQRKTKANMVRIACSAERRVVDDHLRVSYKNVHYQVPQYVDVQGAKVPTIGKQIYVYENKYGELAGKLIHDNSTETFELAPFEASKWGEFESFKHTMRRKRADKIKDQGLKIAGSSKATDADKKPVKKQGKVTYMGPETEDIEPEGVFSGKSEQVKSDGRIFDKEFEARAYIGRQVSALGYSTGDVIHQFSDLFDDMPVAQADIDDRLTSITHKAVNH